MRGEHRYVLLGTDDDAIEDADGLGTVDCLDFIVRQAARREILVAFAFNYDVNMILRDVARPQLEELWETGETELQADGYSYLVEWIPSKLFAVQVDDPETGRRHRAKVWDTWGFFQASFVKALKTWEVEDPTGTIAAMKASRALFTLAQLPEIRAYNAAECRLLVELMGRVRAALHDVDLRPRSWLGAGSIASTLLLQHAVSEKTGRAGRSPHLEEDVIMRAYFGGRSEVFRQGVFEQGCAWDLNSAYPAACVRLPVGRGTWRRRRDHDPGAAWAFWRVRWRIPDGPLAPFPYRERRSIHYPLEGAGWYHAVELEAAIRVFGMEAFDVSNGYVFEPESDERPFAFVADVFERRRELKAAGHPGEKVLKLGINSVYGKLAQGTARNGIRPRFQDYFWSGWVTAWTRAQLLEAIAQAPEACCSAATDGLIFSGAEPDLERGPGLGQWERTAYRNLFIGQPGMYAARAGRQTVHRSRGFFTREIDFPALKRTWLADGPAGIQHCRTHRFVGLGSALMRTDFDAWRSWEDGVRVLSLTSSRKHYDPLDEGQSARRLKPPRLVSARLSDRYVPKRTAVELDPDEAEFVQGTEQPQLVET